MKTFPTLTGSLALSALLLTARAQAPTATPTTSNPAKTAAKTADRRAAAYKGPKVVKDTKTLGTKMLRDSKPAPKPVAPVKQ